MGLSTLLIYSVCIFSAAFLGGMLPLWLPLKKDSHLKLFVSFGAGLLLGLAFLHMLPESSHLIGDRFGIWFLLGFVILLVLERFVMIHACEEHGCHYHTVGITAFLGLTVHGLIEGLALGSSIVLPPLAFLVLLAIVSHKGPSGIALTSILRMSGRSTSQIVLFNLGVALSGPLGLLLAYAFMKTAQIEETSGALLALSAGTFLYIGGCDLLPELHRTGEEKFKRLVAFLFGLGMSYLSGAFIGHSH